MCKNLEPPPPPLGRNQLNNMRVGWVWGKSDTATEPKKIFLQWGRVKGLPPPPGSNQLIWAEGLPVAGIVIIKRATGIILHDLRFDPNLYFHFVLPVPQQSSGRNGRHHCWQWNQVYCMSKKSWNIFYSNLLHDMGQYLLDIQYGYLKSDSFNKKKST